MFSSNYNLTLGENQPPVHSTRPETTDSKWEGKSVSQLNSRETGMTKAVADSIRGCRPTKDPEVSDSDSESNSSTSLSSQDANSHATGVLTTQNKSVSVTHVKNTPPEVYRSSRYQAAMSKFFDKLAAPKVPSMNPVVTIVVNLGNEAKIETDPRIIREVHYPKLLKALREAYNSVKDNANTCPDKIYVQDLCVAFSTTDLRETGMKDYYNESKDPSFNPTNIEGLKADEFVGAFKHVKTRSLLSRIKNFAASLFRRLKANSIGRFQWDPAIYSVRSKLYDLQIDENQNVTLLRSACPVMGYNNKLELDPIFEAIVDHTTRNGQNFLYMNNQSADYLSDARVNTKSLLKRLNPYERYQAIAESRRSEFIKKAFKAKNKVDKSVRGEGKVHLMSQAHDSVFYRQKGESNATSKALIEHLVGNYERGQNGYGLPSDYTKVQKHLRIIFRNLLNDEFEGKEDLTRDERRLFITRAHTKVEMDVMKELNITQAVNICKDGVDRAAGSAANQIIESNRAKFSQDVVDMSLMDDLIWVLGSASVLNHGRAPKKSRHTRAIAAINRCIQAFKTTCSKVLA